MMKSIKTKEDVKELLRLETCDLWSLILMSKIQVTERLLRSINNEEAIELLENALTKIREDVLTQIQTLLLRIWLGKWEKERGK